MHPNPRQTGPDTTTVAFQNPGSKVFAGSSSCGRNLCPLLYNLEVNGVGKDVLIHHLVVVDSLVTQLAIQGNDVPLLIGHISNDAKHAISQILIRFQADILHNCDGDLEVKRFFLSQQMRCMKPDWGREGGWEDMCVGVGLGGGGSVAGRKCCRYLPLYVSAVYLYATKLGLLKKELVLLYMERKVSASPQHK